MKWLTSVRTALAGGSRSAPATPAASPNMPSKADQHAKQVSCKQNPERVSDLRNRALTVMVRNWWDVCWFWLFPHYCYLGKLSFWVCLLAWGFPNQFSKLSAAFIRLTQLWVFSWIACFLYFYDPSYCAWIWMQWKWALRCKDETVCPCVCIQPVQNHCPGMPTRSHKWDWVYFVWISCFSLLTVSLIHCFTVLLYGKCYTLLPVPSLPLCPNIIKIQSATCSQGLLINLPIYCWKGSAQKLCRVMGHVCLCLCETTVGVLIPQPCNTDPAAILQYQCKPLLPDPAWTLNWMLNVVYFKLEKSQFYQKVL